MMRLSVEFATGVTVPYVCIDTRRNEEEGFKLNQTPWPKSASELYSPTDRRMSAKLVPTFVERGCYVVSLTDPYGRILGFLDRSRYFSTK
jgi:hypothetical protein